MCFVKHSSFSKSLQVEDKLQSKIRFTKKNAKDKLNSILMDEKRSVSIKNNEKEGEICFENFDFNYYKNGPKVLRSITFKIRPGEKIGIGKL